MGQYQYTDEQTGKVYLFNHGGDAPSDQDFAEMQQYISQDRARLNALAEYFTGDQLTPEGDGTALGRGFDRGKTSAYSALGTAARDIGEATGFGFLENLGSGMEESARREQLRESIELPAPMTSADIKGLGSGLSYLGEIAGQTAPEMGATLGATAAGTVLGTPLTGLAAGTATAMPFFYGRNIQRQETQVNAGELAEKDRMDAFLAAGGQSILNSVGERLLLAGKLFGISIPASKNLFVRSGQFAATGAAVEVPTEITQQVLERAQAGLPLDDDEAIQEYIEVGIAAGLLGGAVGGVSGPFRGSRPQIEDDAEAPAAAPEAAPGLAGIPRGLPQTISDVADDLGLPKTVPLRKKYGSRPFYDTEGRAALAKLRSNTALPTATRTKISDYLTASADLATARQTTGFPSVPATPLRRPARPASVVLDELKVAPGAPIRSKLKNAIETDNRFLEELQRYSRLPGVKKETKIAIADYLAKPKEVAPAPEPSTAPSQAPSEGAVDGQLDDGGRREGVPSDTRRVGKRGRGPSVPEDTPGAAAPAGTPLGIPSPDPRESAGGTGQQPGAVKAAPEAAPIALPLPDGTQADVAMYDITSFVEKAAGVSRAPRAIAIREVNGVKVPFYLSTGEGGKTDVPSGKWYPFFGLSKTGWFNKSSGRAITDYYFTPELRAAAEALDASVGDIRGDTTVPTVTRDTDTAFVDFINQDMRPSEPNTEAANTNIIDTIKRIKQGTAPEAAPQAAPEATPEATLAAEQMPPNLRRPVVPEPTLRRPEGATVTPTGQLIPAGVAGVQGKQLEAQKAAQREPIAQQMTTKARLEQEVKDLQAALTRRAVSARAKEEGVKPSVVKDRLQRQLNRTSAQLYNVTSYLRSEAGRQQAEIEGAQDAVNLMERADNVSLRQQLRDWFRSNASEELVREADADSASALVARERARLKPVEEAKNEAEARALQRERDRLADREARLLAQEAAFDQTTAGDKRTLLDLLTTSKEQLKKDKNARNAHAYFSKYPDPNDALAAIAFDLSSPDVPKIRRGSKATPLSAIEQGTGRNAATAASEWVEKNLSFNSIAYMDEQIAEYTEGRADALGNTLDQEQMTRREREKNEAAFLKSYYDAESALRGTEAFEDTTPDALTAEELDAIGKGFGDALLRAPRRSIVYGLQAPFHPDIVRALNKGDLRGALRGLADTSTDPYISKLAAGLIPYVGKTKVYTTDNVSYAREVLRDDDTGKIDPGAYLLLTAKSKAAIAKVDPAVAELMQDAIFLNSATGMNAHILLHEMIHAATIKALTDPTNPVRARLESLRKQVEPLLDQDYGLKNTLEFAAEAMSNQEFQAKLAQLYPNDRKASAFTQFWRNVVNFVRTRVLKWQPVDYTAMSVGPEAGAGKDSVFDEVDFLVRTIFDAAPEVRADNNLYEDSLIPLRAEARLNGPAGRIKDFTKLDQQKIDNFLAAGGASRSGLKRFALDAFVGLVNMLEPAGKYLGRSNVDDLYKALTGHSGAIHRLNQRARQTVDDIMKLVPKDKTDLFNDVRLISSELQIDPRRKESFYTGYTLAYKKLNAKGEMDGVELLSYPTKAARDSALVDLNARLKQDTDAGKAASRTQARVHRDFDQETLDAYRKIRRQWEALGPDGQKAYNKVIALFENMHKETGRVLKARLDEMLPFQKKLSETLYKDIYEKILADQVVVPYQPLQRQGRFWLAYFYNDPETKQPTLAKQSFLTEGDRAAAYKELQRLKQAEPDLGITDVQAYVKIEDLFRTDNQPAGKFVMDIGRMLERDARAAGNAAQAKALAEGATVEQSRAAAQSALGAEMARARDIQGKIVKLALEMTPERSILNSYRRRQNIKGYLGDKTPISQKLSRTDTTNLLLTKAASLSRQLADMEYGSKARAAVNRMTQEFTEGQLSGRLGLDEQVKAQVYLEAMQDYAGAIYRDRSRISKLATSLGFGLTLGANISSATLNFFAIPTIIAPYLSGQYGMRQTVKALGNAMRVYGGSGRERTVEFINERGETETRRVKTNLVDYSLDNYEMDENSRYYYLREEGRARGLFHNSINYDTLDIEGSIGTSIWDKLNRTSGFLFHHLERSVRESTLIAAYDLEVQRLQAEKAKRGQPTDLTVEEKQAAANKAAYMTEMTNGSISAAAAPKLAQGNIGAPFYLFRRYPLAMYNLLLSVANKSFPSKAKLAEMYGEGTPEYNEALMMRKVARFQFGGIVGSVGLWAGASGLPMYGAFAALFDTLFTDDDEEDFDTIVRTSLGELGFKGIGNYFFGTEMSSRIGLSNTFYREPLRADSQGAVMNLIEGAGGPIASLLIKYSERIPALLSEGEYYRAAEASLPASIGSVMRALRFAQGGAETLRGDVIYDDFGPYSLMAQAMGFSSADYIRQLEVNTQLKNIDTAIVEKKSKLMRRLNLARRNNDAIGMREVLADIREYNQRHPQQAITRDTLKRSARTFEQTTQRAVNGMIFNNRNLPIIRQMAADYDSPTTFWEQFGLN
jgi:hypothetical protein